MSNTTPREGKSPASASSTPVAKGGNASVPAGKGGSAPVGGKSSKGANTKGGNTSAQAASAPEKVALVSGTVLALCDGVPASGLFIIFKSAPQGDGAKFRSIWDVLWGDLAEQQDDSQRLEFVSDDDFRRYQRQYTLSIVDGEGFLQPVLEGSNPWKEIYPQLEARRSREAAWARKKRKEPLPLPTRSLNPYALVLQEKMQVEVCLLRHPSPHLARALTRYLNTGEDKHGYGFKKWGDRKKLLHKLPIDVGGQEGKQLLLKLPTVASAYVPHGSSDYGGWTLYRDMPLGERADVVEAVKKLQLDLGALRYPVGGGRPYFPEKNLGIFDVQLTSAVHAFQIDAARGDAFQVARSQLPHAHPKARSNPRDVSGSMRRMPKASWAYLLGTPVKRTPDLELSATEPGVVDVFTATAIKKWLADGLRKPGDVLIEVATGELHGKGFAWNEWGRSELVTSIELWRDLVRAFGSDYGIEFGHTFRELASPGGEGKAEFSIHKTGMAVDLAMRGAALDSDDLQDYSRPVPHWPIRYEADWHPDKSAFMRNRERAWQAAKAAREAAEKKLIDARSKAKTALEAAQKNLAQAETAQQTAQSQLDDAVLARQGVRAKTKILESATRRVTESRQAVTARQNEFVALDTPEHPLQQALTEAKQQELQAKAEFDDAPRIRNLTKADWHIRWRLYGHSTWDITLSPDNPDVLKKKVAEALGPRGPQAEYRFVEEYRKSLLGCFPDPKAAEEWSKPHLNSSREVADRLMSLSSAEVLERYFRSSVYQWNYNPYELDGGTSSDQPIFPDHDAPEPPDEKQQKSSALPKSVSVDYLDASIDANMEGVSVEARSFVNLTRLAFECDMWRIRAQQAGWRDPKTDPEGTKRKPPTKQFIMDRVRFGPVAGLLDRMLRPGSPHAQDMVLLKGQNRTLERMACLLDVDFMKRWAKALMVFTGPLRQGPTCEMVITLDTTEQSKQNVAAKLREYGDKRFMLMGFGNRVKLKDPVDVATGERWAQLVEGAFDAFRAWVNEEKERKAKEDESAEANSPMDRRKRYKSAKQAQGKKPPPPKEPQLTGDWTLTLQPIFDLPADPGTNDYPDEPFTFLAGDTVDVPTPGNGRTLEWWHYETKTANSTTWGQLLAEVGYSIDVLGQPKAPPDTDMPRSNNQGGMGFDPGTVLNVEKGGGYPEPPENESKHRLEGG